MLTFEQPLLLLFLLPIGALVFFAWRRMSLPFPKRQRWLILGSRLLLFALIICALAGAAWSEPVTKQSVVFVGDISASTGPQRAYIEQWITSAIRHKGPDDQVGIVAVGRNALVEQSINTQINFSQFQSTPDSNYTDLAAGLRLAAAILPTNSQRRIVLLSDGQQNLGDALQEAQLLQQEGIRLDIVPLPSVDGADPRIDGLTAPENLQTNERFILRVRLNSNVAEKSTLRLYLDQTLLTQQSVQLVGGQQEVDFSILAPPPGFHTYRVTLDAPVDSVLQNNEAAAFVNVQGPPRVLVVEGQPGDGRNITAALQATGITVTVGTPNDIPVTLAGLVGYSSIVLANVPAVELGTERMLIIQAYVRDLGRGLVVSGGENSYGVGGYANTPLEQTLPVSMAIPQHKDTPSIAVVLIIESLESDVGVNISKEAAKGVINLLTPNDQVGVSAAYGSLVVPMQHVTNKTAIDHAIDAMDPNDPASYLPDLINAEAALLKSNAKIKHVILLGDGDAFDTYAPQVLKMSKEQITVSTVATNSQSYQELGTMQQIATWGKGRFYRADDPTTIPQILLQETQQAARRAIINEAFTPETVGNHPILTGIGPLPILNGYVATTPKPAAQLVLVSHLSDPVLAVWQYGLGRVAAWTSDALGLWTANWLGWSNSARWWANIVTWTLPSSQSALDVNATVVNGTGQLTVDLPPGAPALSGSQQAQVRITAPDLSHATLPLQPTAPGRWQGNFPADQVGAYLLQVSIQGKNNGTASTLASTTGLVVPYSPEYRSLGTDTRFLTLLAHAGGGSLLAPNNLAAAFASNLPPVSAAVPITFLLLILATLLLPIDIALRRLSSLEFLVLGYRWLLARFKRAAPQLAAEAAQLSGTAVGSTLGNLRTQRTERRIRAASATPATTASGKHSTKATKRNAGTSPLDTLQAKTPQTPQATKAPIKQEKAVQTKQPEVSTTEKLLEAKRNRAKAQSRKED